MITMPLERPMTAAAQFSEIRRHILSPYIMIVRGKLS